MTTSKNFFEGHSRSKDMLTTIADHMTSATIELPWTIKSQGRLEVSSSEFNNYMHVCLRKEMPTGEVMNLLFVDTYNTLAAPDNYGYIRVYMSYNDSFDAPNGSFINMPLNTRTRQRWVNLSYHSNAADLDANPQFGWYWIWVDNTNLHLTVFGNTGAAGSATPTYTALSLTYAEPVSEKFIGTEVIVSYNANEAFLLRSHASEYYYEAAPSMKGSWVNRKPQTTLNNTSSYSIYNPDPLTNKFVAEKVGIVQATNKDNYWRNIPIRTHEIKNKTILFCNYGETESRLARGDIITIDEEGCDYVYQYLNLNSHYYPNYFLLIKRAESAQNIVLQENSGNIDITVNIPSLCYGIKIIRKIDFMPTDINDGDIVVDENTDGALITGASFAFSDLAVPIGETYYYRAFAFDSNGTISAPVSSATASIEI